MNVSRVVDSGLLATRAGNLHGWQRIMSERGVRCGGKREREERLYLSLSGREAGDAALTAVWGAGQGR